LRVWFPIEIIGFLTGMASSAWADGFRNPFHGVAANAQGTAFIAQANVGFIWRSQAVLPLDGELLAKGTKVADASTQLRLPESFEGGLAY